VGDAQEDLTVTDKLVAITATLVPDIVGLFAFWGAAYYSYYAFIWTKSPYLQLLFLSVLLAVGLIRAIALVSHLILSPTADRFRILSIPSRSAIVLHRVIIGTGIYIISTLMFTVVAFRLGAARGTISLLSIAFASVLLLVSAILVIVFKGQIQKSILESADSSPTWGRKQFAALWHVPALLYILLLCVLLVNTIDSSDQSNSRAAFIISFFVLPFWMIADLFIQWIVKYLMATLKIHGPASDTRRMTDEDALRLQQGKVWHHRCAVTARTCLALTLLVWIASLWGFNLPLITKFTSVFFDASMILALALMFWKFVSTWIEKKIEESTPEETESENNDDEWGGVAKRGRAYTLLPMIRKFISSILVVMVTMMILSSMGVDIGPLLAGAGVIGLAIGFGAQKLVADIFSGFFYLLDDAFRVGEYLEAGSVSGIVENITLRNVMLRHHRGMLQIVPHSELGAITNFMRGGIVVKFNLDFQYDADIDRIRKVIKKVGQSMLTDEELGKDFIKPLKSQGVREITNSVMTIRVKFTAQPGAHFVIRREAYKRITEALNAQNIQYAHRKVIVDIATEETLTKQQRQAAGAAAFLDSETSDQKQSPPLGVDNL
jgi:small-conductance mechanosensitive channel